VNGWVLACLTIMAIALVAMAVGQLILAITAARMARQAAESAHQFRRELGPVLEKVRQIADDASKTSAIAVIQAQRIDQLMESTARRIDETVTIVQNSIITPVRHGAAVIAGLRAALEVFKGAADRHRAAHSRDEDDALFIG
jgi:ABC-type transport system involved in cytochrome bd biosynthesis fused ATPase/permease subunit